MTDDLIARLAADTPKVSANAAGRRFGLGLMIGGVATFAVVLVWLGLRPDMDQAMHGMRFWMKAAYTMWVTLAALPLAIALSRPGGKVGKWPWLVLAAAPALMALMSLGELIRTPDTGWLALVVGDSISVCSKRILLLSLPIFAALVWVFRRLAPTRLTLAGFAAGLIAGGLSATLYGLHCQETSATFVTLWYTLGMVASGLLGAATSRWLLRW